MNTITQNIPEDLNMFKIQDILSIDWTKFDFTGTETDYMLGEEDIKRPDLLSYKLYGTVIYQDIIFILNGIGDILNTSTLTIIKIPKIIDIKAFIKKYKKS
jgi:hypothetical protein